MRKHWSRLIVCLVAALLLAACGKDKQAANDSATPEAAVLTSARLLKAGDFDALWKHLLPPAEYQTMRAQWGSDRDLSQVTPADRQRFEQTMQRLTQPDAKQTLLADLQPQLKAYQTHYKTRLPMMIGMGQTMVATRIEQSDSMTPPQKAQAKEVLGAVADWARNTAWDDPDKAKQAVGIVVDSARKLDLKTLDQAYALDYTQAMQRYTTAWNGLKQLLAVYGLSIDQTLDSVQAKTLQTSAPAAAASAAGNAAAANATAKVEVSYSILGKPMTSTLNMVRMDGRWYDADVLRRWKKEHAKDQAMRAAPASSGSAAAAVAASTSGH